MKKKTQEGHMGKERRLRVFAAFCHIRYGYAASTPPPGSSALPKYIKNHWKSTKLPEAQE